MSKELSAETTPIYLGYEVSTKKYYFYFLKEGVPRFLVYCTYFYWGVGPQTALSLSPIPSGIEEDLQQFLSGTLCYEFKKLRKNSRVSTPVKIYRIPTSSGELSGERAATEVVAVQGENGRRRRARVSKPGIERIPAGDTCPRTNLPPTSPAVKPRRVRRTKQQMQEFRASLELKKLQDTVMDVSPERPSNVTSKKTKSKS